jgi:hypothetical protein
MAQYKSCWDRQSFTTKLVKKEGRKENISFLPYLTTLFSVEGNERPTKKRGKLGINVRKVLNEREIERQVG